MTAQCAYCGATVHPYSVSAEWVAVPSHSAAVRPGFPQSTCNGYIAYLTATPTDGAA